MCGAVQFRACGEILFNQLCHCRSCGWAASTTPVHIIGVKTPSLEYSNGSGSDKVIVTKGHGNLEHARCKECLTQVYQKPKGMDNLVAVFPPTFHIGGDDSIDQKLPPMYLPNHHANYENRAMDCHDNLPKFKCFGPEEMNNDGTLKE